MNNKTIIHLTNKIALAFIVILIYWVFIFSMMTVFDFKIFRQNMTEAFAFSVMGILAILCGAVIINVMLNLTRIADKQQDNTAVTSSFSFKWLAIFLLSFPLIFVGLYAGDYATKQKKERLMIASAQSLITDKSAIISQLEQYRFDYPYLSAAQENIRLLRSIDRHFPDIHVLVLDHVHGEPVILSLNRHSMSYNTKKNNEPLRKIDFVYSTSSEERQYLLDVLLGKSSDIRYDAHKSNYKLYYPVQSKQNNHKNIVILLSDYLRYGKYGS